MISSKKIFSLIVACSIVLGGVNISPVYADINIATPITPTTTGAALSLGEPVNNRVLKPGETAIISNNNGTCKLSLRDNNNPIKVDYLWTLADGTIGAMKNDCTYKLEPIYIQEGGITKITNEGYYDLQLHAEDSINSPVPVEADNLVSFRKSQNPALSTVTIKPNETYSIINFSGKNTSVKYNSPCKEVHYMNYVDYTNKDLGTLYTNTDATLRTVCDNSRVDVTNTNSYDMTLTFDSSFVNAAEKNIVVPNESIEISNTTDKTLNLSLSDNIEPVKFDYVSYSSNGYVDIKNNMTTTTSQAITIESHQKLRLTNKGISNLKLHVVDISDVLNPIIVDSLVGFSKVNTPAVKYVTINPGETYSIINYTGKATYVLNDNSYKGVYFTNYEDEFSKGNQIEYDCISPTQKCILNNSRLDIINANDKPTTIMLDGTFINSLNLDH